MLKIGHRGAAGHVLENSMSSFKKAIELKVDSFEFDVRLTKDSVPVVFHDKTIDRLTDSTGYLRDYRFCDLFAKVRLKNGERIPSLAEVCELIAKEDVKIYAEIKEKGSEDKVVSMLLRYLKPHKLCVGSFFHESIKKIKNEHEDIETIAIIAGVPTPFEDFVLGSRCDYVALAFDFADESLVERVHRLNKGIFVWTVNDHREIERAGSMGVDGIISDFPDRI